MTVSVYGQYYCDLVKLYYLAVLMISSTGYPNGWSPFKCSKV